MKQLLYIFILIISITTNLFSQSDSLKKELLNYNESKPLIISNGRRLIIDNLNKNDKKKVKEIFDYLTTMVEDQYNLAFYTSEKFLLYYYTEEFNHVLSDIINYDSIINLSNHPYYYIQIDSLSIILQNTLGILRNEIHAKIDLSEYDNKNKDFLKLNLDDILFSNSYNRSQNGKIDIITQDSLNKYADKFLALYGTTEYDYHIRSRIRLKYKCSNFSYGGEFFVAYNALTDDLNQKFNNFASVGAKLNGSYKKLILSVGLNTGSGKTKDSIQFPSVTWTQNQSVDYKTFEGSLGYILFKKKPLRVIPFAGIASVAIQPDSKVIEDYPEFENSGLDYTTTYSFGINLEYFLFSHSVTDDSNVYVNLRYTYYLPQFEKKYTGFNGNMHLLTLGLGLNNTKTKRDY